MSIDSLRSQIDEMDREIVRLLNRRAQLAIDIGKLKETNNSVVYAPGREEQVFRKIIGESEGPLPEESIRSIYTEIISACRALERKPRVAYLGPEGTFSHHGARMKFGGSVEFIPVSTIREVFPAVMRGEADYGVVPVENSSEGGIGECLDSLLDSPLRVCGEILIPVHNNLMAKCGFKDVKRIYSKSVVFGQCSNWLSSHMGQVELKEVDSTAKAARLAAEEENAAVIGHEQAARIYNLNILARNIENDPNNTTRFFVLGQEYPGPTGKDKSSVLCFIKDEVGALLKILQPFQDHGLNLTFIESYPSRRRLWDYCFFIDFEGHVDEDAVKPALDEVRGQCKELKILGSYPRC